VVVALVVKVELAAMAVWTLRPLQVGALLAEVRTAAAALGQQ
jgi:hypothetical protein